MLFSENALSFPYDLHGQTHYEYLDQHQILVPWANSMVIQVC